MKKKVVLSVVSIFIIFLLIMPIISALDTQAEADKAKADLTKTTDYAKSFAGKSSEIPIPPYIEVPARAIFKIEGDISLTYLSVLIAVTIVLVFVIKDILEFSPFPFSNWVKWVIIIGLMLVTIVSSGVKIVASLIIGALNHLAFVQKYNFLIIVIAIILVFLILIPIKYMKKQILNAKEIMNAESEGRKAHAAMKTVEAVAKSSLGEG